MASAGATGACAVLRCGAPASQTKPELTRPDRELVALRASRVEVAQAQKSALCSDFVRVSDGTRTRERLDHNQELCAPRGETAHPMQ
jgi:hypothetical protein